MTKNKDRLANRRISAKLAIIKRAAGDEAEDVIDDVSDALDVEKDDVVEVVVDDPEGLVAELEVAGETELAGEVQEISLKVRQDDDVDVREEARRARRIAARRRAMAAARRNRHARRVTSSWHNEKVIEDVARAMVKLDGFNPDRYSEREMIEVENRVYNELEDIEAIWSDDPDEARDRADMLLEHLRDGDFADVASELRRKEFGYIYGNEARRHQRCSGAPSSKRASSRNRHSRPSRTGAAARHAGGRAARSRMARANIRRAYAWDLLDDFVKAMGVEDVEDGRERAKNTLDALADGTENVQTYVDHLREKGDDFCDQVADRLLSEFGKVDISADDDAPEPEPEVIDTDDADDGSDNGMPYDASDGEESREAARRRVDRSLAAARARAAKAGATTARKASNAKAAPAPARKASKARPSGVDAPVRVTRRAPVTATRRTASDDGAAYNLFY